MKSHAPSRTIQFLVTSALLCLVNAQAFGQAATNGSMTGPVVIGSPPPSWSVIGASGDTIGPGGFNGWGTGIPASTDGGTFLALLSNGGGGNFDTVSQMISGFTPGQTYALTYEYSNIGLTASANYANSGFIRATIAGVNLDSPILSHLGYGNQQWFCVTLGFVATAASHQLTLSAERQGLGGYAGGVDGVQIIVNSGSPYCFGDGTGTACPCGANGALGTGCLNTAGSGALLFGTGIAVPSFNNFSLTITGAPPSKPGLLLRGNVQFGSGLGVQIGDGLLCVVSQTARSHIQVTSPAGTTTFTHFQGSPFGQFGGPPGTQVNYQFWYRDSGNPCTGSAFNFSNAWTMGC